MTLAMHEVSTVPHDVPPRAMTREVPMLGCILVVEDDPAIATVVEETLTAEGYAVVCTGAWGALRLAREVHPDVILLGRARHGRRAHLSHRRQLQLSGRRGCHAQPVAAPRGCGQWADGAPARPCSRGRAIQRDDAGARVHRHR